MRKTTPKVVVTAKKRLQKSKPLTPERSDEEELAEELLASDEVQEEEPDDHTPARENITENTYVLVKYETGKLSVFYAGCVLNCEETSIRVNFMRKVGDYCSFVYPDTEDIHEVGYESEVLILGAPIQSGGTTRV